VRAARWIAAVLWPIVVFAGVFVGGGFLFLGPPADEEYELEVALYYLKHEYASKKRMAANVDAHRAQIEEVARMVERVRRVLPDAFDPDFPAVREAARRRGVRITEAKLAPEELREFYARLPMHIKLAGRYHDLGGFAADVEKAPGSLLLQNLRLAPAAVRGQVTLEADVVAFRHRTDAEVEAHRKKAATGARP